MMDWRMDGASYWDRTGGIWLALEDTDNPRIVHIMNLQRGNIGGLYHGRSIRQVNEVNVVL